MSKKKTTTTKTAEIRSRPSKMRLATQEKTRIVLSCTEEEKRYIKVLAALESKSISDYLLDQPRKKMPHAKCNFQDCDGVHTPNKKTSKVLRDTEKGLNLESHESLEDFWKAMGIKPDVED